MKFHTLLHTLAVAVWLSPAARAGTIYVDASASGANDGSSWADAYPDLQDALAAAAAGDEIWAAKGTYTPGALEADTFTMKDEVALYGGFDGDESFRYQRDAGALVNATILSGEIGDPGDRTDNTHHIVTGSQPGAAVGADAVLDGFTISAAYVDDEPAAEHLNWGGGFVSRSGGASGATLRNCHFFDNDSTGRGAGASVFGSNTLFEECHFSQNRALTGASINIWGSATAPEIRYCTFVDNDGPAAAGGIMIVYGSPLIRDCLFQNNNGGFGGAIYFFNCNATLRRCRFIDNTGSRGGAINFQQPGVSLFSDCLFANNTATNHGGAIFLNNRSTPIFTNVTVTGNASPTEGGAVYADDNDTIVTFQNSILWNNTVAGSTASASVVAADGAVTNFTNCIAQNITGSDPLLGAEFRPGTASPAIDQGDGALNSDPFDLAGAARIQGTMIDIGAFEAGPTMDDLWETDADDDGMLYGLDQAIAAQPSIDASGGLTFAPLATATPRGRWIVRRSTDLDDFSEILYGPSPAPPASPFMDPNGNASERTFYRLDLELAPE